MINYNFPKTKFVDENGIAEQLKKILSEIDELRLEIPADGERADIVKTYDEVCDILQAIETFARIDEQTFHDALIETTNKNYARGYYVPLQPSPLVKENTVVKSEYKELEQILMNALDQAQNGKGKERHGQNLPFEDQPIIMIPKLQNSDIGLMYQAIKKLQESQRMDKDAAIDERLGAINYIAASILFLENT